MRKDIENAIEEFLENTRLRREKDTAVALKRNTSRYSLKEWYRKEDAQFLRIAAEKYRINSPEKEEQVERIVAMSNRELYDEFMLEVSQSENELYERDEFYVFALNIEFETRLRSCGYFNGEQI